MRRLYEFVSDRFDGFFYLLVGVLVGGILLVIGASGFLMPLIIECASRR